MSEGYRENLPFIFVSYKHQPADEAVVKKTIDQLRKRYGFNIWYDAELTAGTNWDKIALRRVRSTYCKMVLFFASTAALTSQPVAEELATAKSWQKKIVPISFESRPFSDILMGINAEFNESDPDKVDIADEIIRKHLDDKLTYIVADINSDNYYHDIFRTVSKNAPEIIESAAQGDPAPKAAPAPAPRPVQEAAPLLEGPLPHVTLGEIRRRFLSEEFCLKVQDLRKNRLPFGGKGPFDYAMAALLGGCNSVKQPWQINYYQFAIADPTKKTQSGTAATWTWSSNCRKVIGMTGSGQIDAQRDAWFAALPEDTTVAQILEAFERAEEEVYRTAKNPLVIQGLRMFAGLL